MTQRFVLLAGMVCSVLSLVGAASHWSGHPVGDAPKSVAASSQASQTSFSPADTAPPMVQERIQLASAASDLAVLQQAAPAALGSEKDISNCGNYVLTYDTNFGGPSESIFISTGTEVTFTPIVTRLDGSTNGLQVVQVAFAWPDAFGEVFGFDPDTNAPLFQEEGPFTPPPSGPPIVHNYPDTGTYRVGMRAYIRDTLTGEEGWCPQPGGIGDGLPTVNLQGTVNVADTSGISSAGFTIEDEVLDGTGLMPANDWVPLASIIMSFTPDDPAPRMLGRLVVEILGDSLQASDILEFGIFEDRGGDGGAPNGEFEALNYNDGAALTDPRLDPPLPLFTFDSKGSPFDAAVPLPTAPGDDNVNNDNFFDLRFTDLPPDLWLTAGPDPGRGYFLCVRTSSAWQFGDTLGIRVPFAQMLQIATTDNNGNPLPQPIPAQPFADDSYSPDFGEGPLDAGTRYTSSFLAYDFRSPLPLYSRFNQMNWPNYQYTPNAEFNRFRFNATGLFLESVLGQALDIRDLISIESWAPLLALDLHGTRTGNILPQPSEVNIVLTDIGADPFGPPGNGGFDPRNGRLSNFTSEATDIGDDLNFAVGEDHTFNGIGVFADSNNDGDFQPPVTTAGTFGVNMTGRDHPLYVVDPSSDNAVTSGLLEWEYVPFPPGGGDPWWRAKIALSRGARPGDRALDNTAGTMEGVPDVYPAVDVPRPDYFIVMNADSGYRDVSGLPGDRTALPLGADMRAFVEPRRWNPQDGGHWDGGIRTSNQWAGREFEVRNNAFIVNEVPFGSLYWQDDPRLDTLCGTNEYPCDETPDDLTYAWWTNRTQNQTTAKPVKTGIDVHDLVLTYSTNNQYAKYTIIRELQSSGDISDLTDITGFSVFSAFQDPPIIRTDTIEYENGLASFDLFGILQLNFFRWQQPLVVPDALFAADDVFLPEHYAYETVPFKLNTDAINTLLREPRSVYFPNPQEQPTLPALFSWPPFEAAVAFGFQSYCYLESEGALANEEYLPAETNNSEATYADDVYVFVVEDCNNCGAVQPGMWLIDRYGARYSITAVSGNRFTLAEGHNAYLDKDLRFPNGNQSPILELEDHPFGVRVGEQFAVERGTWAVVEDAIQRTQYARQQDWPAGLEADGGARAARILKQKVEVNSVPTAMLGINLAAVDDVIVNASETISLNSVTVAFWGPEFDRSDLAQLDPDGALVSSGVLLYEDSNGNGVFNGPIIEPLTGSVLSAGDRVVPLETGSLQWQGTGAEPIDIDGDFVADDLSGDGFIALSQSDREDLADEPGYDGLLDTAWVLRLEPAAKWTLPFTDPSRIVLVGANKSSGLLNWPSFWTEAPTLSDIASTEVESNDKQLGTTANGGDDLFVAVRTSNTLSQFEQFRAIIPSKLPTRTPASEKVAGIEMSPETYPVVQAFMKTDPEEGVVQSFLGHDMLEASVPAKVADLTTALVPSAAIPFPVIEPGSAPVAMLGIDASANRPANYIGAGSSGSQAAGGYSTASFSKTPSEEFYDGGWTDEVIGYYLIGLSENGTDGFEGRVEAFEITGVSNNDLTLRAGQPRVGSPWIVVKDPTFLEQVIVELFDVQLDGDFDPQRDLLPLNFEDPGKGDFSGVSLYRDNDFSAKNRNGVFDPPVLDTDGNVIEYIDLPVTLDAPPTFIGVPGEPEYQIRMVFSTPGTDDIQGRTAIDYESQTRRRQWIPQTFGLGSADPNTGSDFFVVLRTSREMTEGDDFRVGIVSWGPNTPTLPDPDNFTPSLDGGQLPGQRPDEFDIFDEFPWGNAGLGFITFFKDPQPIYYWGYDHVQKKEIAVQEVDHSQDDKDIRHWVRSHPVVTGATNVVTSLPAPDIDFTSDRNRQIPGGSVAFTLLTDSTVSSVLWNFGDGETSSQRNPTHVYANAGVYTVSVTVTNTFGVSDTVTKPDYIEITAAPFADFSASPLEGSITPDPNDVLDPGLNVSFVDRSQASTDLVAVKYFWEFGDGQTATTTTRATEEAPLVHRYTKEGFYTVSLEVTFQNPQTQATVISTCQLQNLITVRPCVGCPGSGEGETEAEGDGEGGSTETPAADFEATNLIRDKEALVPLHDWMPLANIVMSYPEDDFAPRILRRMQFRIVPDLRAPDEFGIANVNGPQASDILEFGIFQETYDADGEKNNILDNDFDFLLYTFDNTGSPIGTASEGFSSVAYELNFVGNGTAADPQFLLEAAEAVEDSLGGNSYILAVRTSATWRSQTTLGVQVLDAEMIDPRNGRFPTDEEGAPVDSYTPNFNDGEILEDEVAYSASFSVWDTSGNQFDDVEFSGAGFTGGSPYNFWNHPTFLYTPLQENTRPLWNSVDRLFDLTAGEVLEIRQLISTEQWVPVLAMNIHSAAPEHFDFINSSGGVRDSYFEDHAQLKEVNLVFTDIGGDPLGPPGNGGFNPKEGLDRQTNETWGIYEPVFADDQTYNGVWVWSDNDNNGRFDPPTPAEATNGVVYSPDRPLYSNDALTSWEYIPFPPGGGDPWWKITLRFWGGERRPSSETEEFRGFLDAVPDNLAGNELPGVSDVTFDYFVTVRADSGFQDVSLAPGDQNGIAAGADFRVFVEPRRFDGATGSQTGGIYLDSMTPPEGIVTNGASIYSTWQDDPRWLTEEPWWPERTHNAKSAKPIRATLDVHDLVITYETDSPYTQPTDLFFGNGPVWESGCLTYAVPLGGQTDFDQWNDPFGLQQSKFLNQHSVGVTRWRFFGGQLFDFGAPIGEVAFTFDETKSNGQFAYETAPFFSNSLTNGDAPPVGPRSTVFPVPPAPPTVPDYSTWPAFQRPGEYQRASDWSDENNKARLLKQSAEINSIVTPVLGINVAGADDPVVNQGSGATIGKITVAIWGPEFAPSDLTPLDPQGASALSGVALWEDADGNGTFADTEIFQQYAEGLTTNLTFDGIVKLQDLRWPSAPELVDLNGDGNPDDMDGDGVVDFRDRAWVLDLTPASLWTVPRSDEPVVGFGTINALIFCAGSDFSKANEVQPPLKSARKNFVAGGASKDKLLDPTVPQSGDDLFITVRTSDKASRFEKLRAVIPATLPERQEGQRQAGIQFFPQFNTSATSFIKSNPDEDPVQDFYGHDMLEVGVPAKLSDLTDQNASLVIGGAAVAPFGIDLSTNQGRANGTLDSGSSGVPDNKRFQVPGESWTSGAFANDFLIDENFESFRILTNTPDTLELESGTPAAGNWRIVRNPSFFETLTVEFYNEGTDAQFNINSDLLPLKLDQELSGVAIYRDNDNDPRNRNGIFDVNVDIPIKLDYAPRLVGQTGEAPQVQFTFSTPGTDNTPVPIAQQTRHRQWIYDTFGSATLEPEFGPDFFVVVRASERMTVGDNFRIGIVGYGPNTPTEPDPDTFAGIESEARNDFTKFREFPWAKRAIGFISYSKEPLTDYFMDSYRAGQKKDNSGFDWIRSHANRKKRTGVISAAARTTSPRSVVISGASETLLPSQTLPDQPFTLVLNGSGFGTSPVVVLSGYDVTVKQSNDTTISIAIEVAGETPVEPVVVIVRNPTTGEEASRSDLFKIVSGTGNRSPEISSVSPASGDSESFPVTIFGTNFPTTVEDTFVTFGETRMPVLSVSPDGTSITVGFPAGGLPNAGPLPVTVRDLSTNQQDVLLAAFDYKNDVGRSKAGFFSCAATPAEPSGFSGDLLVVVGVGAMLLALSRRRRTQS